MQGLPARPRCQWVPRGAWTGVKQRRWGRGDTQTQTGSRAQSSAQSHCPGPVRAGRQARSGPPAPPTGRSPSSHTRSRLYLEPITPVHCRPSLRAPQGPWCAPLGPRLRGLPEVAQSLAVCWSRPPPPSDPPHPLGLCLACLGGTPGPPRSWLPPRLPLGQGKLPRPAPPTGYLGPLPSEHPFQHPGSHR